MKAENQNARVGEIRPTQLIYTFGVGSIIDLPYLSVMVMGLDDWDLENTKELSEPRLLTQVKSRRGPQVERLLAPPSKAESESFGNDPLSPDNLVGVPCSPFPRWMRCPNCGLLGPLSSGLFQLDSRPYAPDRSRFVHINCPNAKRPPAVIPVRFMIACDNGHLDDFPWVDFVHRGPTECRAQLRLDEIGSSGEAVDVQVKCLTCGTSRRMADAFGEKAKGFLPLCRAYHPHLRESEEEGCHGSDGQPNQVRTLLLGASNAWFPYVVSTISIPTGDNKVLQAVEDYWVNLKDLETVGEVKVTKGFISDLAPYSAEELWEAIQAKRDGGDGGGEEGRDIKTPEWEVLTTPDKHQPTADFVIAKESNPPDFAELIEKVVLVKKMREVRALVGFTRIDSAEEFLPEGENIDPRVAPLSRSDPKWVPASEVRGEGLFIQFSEEKIQEWVKRKSVDETASVFVKGHRLWRQTRHLEPPEAGFPGTRFILLHSFSHALMRQFSLACGYSSASIRERIYSAQETDPSGPMAGVLIYTVAADSEGTLGGLVDLGRSENLNSHIRQALERSRFCSSDPLCAEHLADSDRYTLHAAACHACLFLPETSCECGNRYLDRSVMVETVDPKGVSFFEK